MKTLTPDITRKIVAAVIPLHLPNYDRHELNAVMWNVVLNFAHYAGFDTSSELARVNSYIKDEHMKLTIHSLEESRESFALMDDFSGDRKWSEEFESNLAAVMAI
jgi:hypothetical protein